MYVLILHYIYDYVYTYNQQIMGYKALTSQLD
jgi:hypothetical protein